MPSTAESAAAAAAVRAPVAAIAALGGRPRYPAVLPAPDPAVEALAGRFLLHEALLLDARRFEDWLALWDPAGLLWVPLDRDDDAGPAERQSIVLDDRVRLVERVARLRSRSGWSQIPVTRTVRHVGNVVAWADGDAVEVRSVLTLHSRRGATSVLAARQEHRLTPGDDGALRLSLKVLDLLDADAALPNLSHLL